MKKIKKAITKGNLKKFDNLFIKDTISLDDEENTKYFDKLSYQKYLINLNKESGDFNE